LTVRGEKARDVKRVKFRLADKRAALVDLGRHLGMFVNKHQYTGKDGGPIIWQYLSR
jgi:phage terminase small subunit